MSALSRDGWLLVGSFALRSAAYGWLAVVLGLNLAARGLEPALIGAVFTAALAGGALLTIAVTRLADRWGRRRVLVGGALLMAASGAALATEAPPWLLLVVASAGALSPSGKDVGPCLPVEQAMLPQTTRDEQRTAVFALYNLAGSVAGALGALVVGVPALLGLDEPAGYRLLALAYVAAALGLAALYGALSPAVEVPPPRRPVKSTMGRATRGTVWRLAALFALDAFAGGFVAQAIVAWWLQLRHGLDLAALGAVFFGANLLAALSFLAAAPLARRLGLLNTMVFTHLPSNGLLLLVPLMPTAEGAVAALLARHLLSQLDVPTRQSYSMAIVSPAERAAAAGTLAVARSLGAALAPAVAAPTLIVPALGLPFLVAGTLKIAYDLTLLGLFRHVRPPEERLARAAPG